MERNRPSKAEEIEAIRSLVERLGPDSYLGPWLQDALPFLADCITCDLPPPLSAAKLHQPAEADRLAAYCLRQEAQLECRQLLESITSRADALLLQAHIEAEGLKERAWQAIRLAIKELEA